MFIVLRSYLERSGRPREKQISSCLMSVAFRKCHKLRVKKSLMELRFMQDANTDEFPLSSPNIKSLQPWTLRAVKFLLVLDAIGNYGTSRWYCIRGESQLSLESFTSQTLFSCSSWLSFGATHGNRKIIENSALESENNYAIATNNHYWEFSIFVSIYVKMKIKIVIEFVDCINLKFFSVSFVLQMKIKHDGSQNFKWNQSKISFNFDREMILKLLYLLSIYIHDSTVLRRHQ